MSRLLALLMTLSACLLALSVAGPAGAQASTPGQVGLVAIDVQPAGNEPNGPLGPVDRCREVAVGDTFTIEVIVKGVPVETPMVGFQFSLDYAPAVLEVLAADDTGGMLNQHAGSHLIPFGNPVPDSDGGFLFASVDFGTDPESAEFGDGILAEITLEAKEYGTSALGLSNVLVDGYDHGDPDSYPFLEMEIAQVMGATVSVGEQCVELPGEEEPPNQPGSPTPPLTPTPPVQGSPSPTRPPTPSRVSPIDSRTPAPTGGEILSPSDEPDSDDDGLAPSATPTALPSGGATLQAGTQAWPPITAVAVAALAASMVSAAWVARRWL